MRLDENDLSLEFEYFSSHGRVKNPKPQRTAAVLKIKTDTTTKKSRRGNAYRHTKTGFRSDIGSVLARSAWEANVIRVMLLHKVPFEFETKTFYFPPAKNGRISAYLPDIYLPDTDEYIEVKGYLDARGRNKLRKFKKNYPSEFNRLSVIISKSNKDNKYFFNKLGVGNIMYYEHLSKLYKAKLINWEGA